MVVTYDEAAGTTFAWALVYFIGIPSQAFTTIIVIHQVSLGRAIGHHDREEAVPPVRKSGEFTAHDIPLLIGGERV
ncbi:hypothetical protein P691DRAFT_801487 [Macrolepiota fuliginosa MF-IS2]|uniref:Uncharacterized protein n=1 Tax=Macrolepiota fuliginosa MF-IS2 TaxID=1400762 RepID=A0A9P5XBI1_9AGAR|nr:hypothetical protein P691DRAFT_801487 [Macrolepiota fuliginosa MF-IS2]